MYFFFFFRILSLSLSLSRPHTHTLSLPLFLFRRVTHHFLSVSVHIAIKPNIQRYRPLSLMSAVLLNLTLSACSRTTLVYRFIRTNGLRSSSSPTTTTTTYIYIYIFVYTCTSTRPRTNCIVSRANPPRSRRASYDIFREQTTQEFLNRYCSWLNRFAAFCSTRVPNRRAYSS